MTMTNLEHTKALEQAATPGPWYWDEDNWLDVAAAHYVIEPDDDGFEDTTQLKVRPEDKAFIAHARSAVPALVAAVERVQALHTQVNAADYGVRNRGAITQVCTGCGQDDGNWQYWPCPTIRALETP